MNQMKLARLAWTIVFSFLVIALLCSDSPARARTTSLQTAPVMQDLQIGSKTFEVGSIVINAPPQAIWTVITDYENSPNVFPYIHSCRVISDSGPSKVVCQRLHPQGTVNEMTEFLALTESPPNLIQWHSLAGSTHQTEGYWKLEPSGQGKTTVTFAKYVNAGPFVPQPIIRHILLADMPPVLLALKSHVENANPAF